MNFNFFCSLITHILLNCESILIKDFHKLRSFTVMLFSLCCQLFVCTSVLHWKSIYRPRGLLRPYCLWFKCSEFLQRFLEKKLLRCVNHTACPPWVSGQRLPYQYQQLDCSADWGQICHIGVKWIFIDWAKSTFTTLMCQNWSHASQNPCSCTAQLPVVE